MGSNETAIERAVSSGAARMTPSEAFVETLVANGVTDVFGIVGSACMDALDLFPAAGIRYVPVVRSMSLARRPRASVRRRPVSRIRMTIARSRSPERSGGIALMSLRSSSASRPLGGGLAGRGRRI